MAKANHTLRIIHLGTINVLNRPDQTMRTEPSGLQCAGSSLIRTQREAAARFPMANSRELLSFNTRNRMRLRSCRLFVARRAHVSYACGVFCVGECRMVIVRVPEHYFRVGLCRMCFFVGLHNMCNYPHQPHPAQSVQQNVGRANQVFVLSLVVPHLFSHFLCSDTNDAEEAAMGMHFFGRWRIERTRIIIAVTTQSTFASAEVFACGSL